ncbi:MAG: hypothetical protein J0H83_19155 [Candidatus Melainabacteria bacterium]|jgi:hypothetical protein|nr:hypothetical protein [Candidatus Melainabacteria bacterium]MBX9674503.1 hypothetical protein [Candidatus Obscuribacterales bacterium]
MKIVLNRQPARLAALFGFAILTCLTLQYGEKLCYAVEDKIKIPNSSSWVHFGPAVIEGCDTILLQFGIFQKNVVIASGDPRFPAIKQWVREHFANKINSTTVFPCCRAELSGDAIRLTRGGGANRVLLYIPLSEATMDKRDSDLQNEIDQLKRLAASGIRPTALYKNRD